jgi:hypothetical protein
MEMAPRPAPERDPREFERNRCADGCRPVGDARRAWARKLRGSNIARSTRLRGHVEDRLAMGWSPEQIAGRMELVQSEHAISAGPSPALLTIPPEGVQAGCTWSRSGCDGSWSAENRTE